jgi:hypothetical protein
MNECAPVSYTAAQQDNKETTTTTTTRWRAEMGERTHLNRGLLALVIVVSLPLLLGTALLNRLYLPGLGPGATLRRDTVLSCPLSLLHDNDILVVILLLHLFLILLFHLLLLALLALLADFFVLNRYLFVVVVVIIIIIL